MYVCVYVPKVGHLHKVCIQNLTSEMGFTKCFNKTFKSQSSGLHNLHIKLFVIHKCHFDNNYYIFP